MELDAEYNGSRSLLHQISQAFKLYEHDHLNLQTKVTLHMTNLTKPW